MINLESGDRIELFYEDAPATTMRATVVRLLTDREEGMGLEVEEYAVSWIEITVDEPNDMDAQQVVLLNTDLQYRLNGRRGNSSQEAGLATPAVGTPPTLDEIARRAADWGAIIKIGVIGPSPDLRRQHALNGAIILLRYIC